MSRMRILHVTECYAGGVKRAMEAHILASPEHEHHLLYSGDEEIDMQSGWQRPTPLPRGHIAKIRAIRAHIGKVQPDIVHLHSSWAGFHTRLRRVPCPVIYEPHCFKFDDPNLVAPARWAFRIAERLLSSRTSAFAVLSSHEAELVRSIAPHARIFHVANTPSISAAPSGQGRMRQRNCVVMSGRLARQKDPEFFLSAARRIRELDDELKLVWVGDGEPHYRTMLEEGGIEVTGWLDHSAVRERMMDAVYMHTASYEGMPLSILDAAMVDAPIVARSIPAVRDLPIMTESTPGDLATTAYTLISPGSWQNRALSANEQIRRDYSQRRLAESLETLYREVA